MEILKKYLEYILIAINAIIMIFGIILIAIGGLALTKADLYHSFIEHGFFSVPGLAIFLGSALTAIFFFGCCGIVRKNRCMTVTFSVFMIVLLLMCIGCGAAAFMLRRTIDGNLNSTMSDSLTKYGNKSYSEITEVWDNVQENLHCCGVNNSTDYAKLNLSIPVSCCNATSFPDRNCTTTDVKQINTDGCYTIVKDDLQIVSKIFNWTMALAIFELLVVIGSCYLAQRFRTDYETV